MNNLKFRFFVDESRVMLDVFCIYFQTCEVFCGFSDAGKELLFEFKDGVLLQSTGLKDKNRVEIFEGDVVRVTNNDEIETDHEVIWGGVDYPAFDLSPTTYDECNSLSHISCEGYQTEVIGNIHENPELLEKQCTTLSS